MCMRLVPGKNNVSVKTTHRTSQQHVLISLLLVEQTYACHCLGIIDNSRQQLASQLSDITGNYVHAPSTR